MLPVQAVVLYARGQRAPLLHADKAADAFQVVRRLGKRLHVVVAKRLQDAFQQNIRLVDVVGIRLLQIFQPRFVTQGGIG
jgi:hypothetical protein